MTYRPNFKCLRTFIRFKIDDTVNEWNMTEYDEIQVFSVWREWRELNTFKSRRKIFYFDTYRIVLSYLTAQQWPWEFLDNWMNGSMHSAYTYTYIFDALKYGQMMTTTIHTKRNKYIESVCFWWWRWERDCYKLRQH